MQLTATPTQTNRFKVETKIRVTRLNPQPGLWNIVVGGFGSFESSAYKLNVDFANVAFENDESAIILGSDLTGEVKISSLTGTDATLDAASSVTQFTGLRTSLRADIFSSADNRCTSSKWAVFQDFPCQYFGGVLNRDSRSPRPEFDIALGVYECNAPDLSENCPFIQVSVNPDTSDELLSFTRIQNKYYRPILYGSSLPTGTVDIILTELVTLVTPTANGPAPVRDLLSVDFQDDGNSIRIAVEASANSPYINSNLFNSTEAMPSTELSNCEMTQTKR